MIRRSILLSLILAAPMAYADPPADPNAAAKDAPPPKPGDKPEASGQPAPSGEAAPGDKDKKPAPAAKDDPAFQTMVWKSIMAVAGGIDQCTAKYSEQYPDRRGTASISIKVDVDGRTLSNNVTSTVQQPDRLIDCMTAASRYWRFEKGPFELTLPVNVFKGAKLHLKQPGAKDEPPPPPPAAGEPAPPAPEGFINFMPTWDQSK